MATYKVRLKHREEVAEGTAAFYFEKPEGLQFKAGQFLRFTLIDPPETDAEGDSRTFSIASAPHERDLMIATRMRNTAFKRVIKTMPLGSGLEFKGAYGRMTLHDDPARPAVFLTGGIGITPFRSMAVDAAHSGLAHRLFLFYSNRRPEDAAFLDELTGLEKLNPRYQCVAMMTAASGSTRPWSGETGYINAEMLARYVDDLESPIYYVAGPEGLVSAMRKTLSEAGIGDTDIHAEEFSGY
ncbi:MAG TPA: FAD-dependent oxidoreductase [Blastocatellia bacterium]|nr:FAD-dependent oxidoreductase [Blastocatellia bacterium]